MTSRLRWVIVPVLVFTLAGWAGGERACAKDRQPELGAPLHTILEVETTARLIAILLDSGRNVINENQGISDDRGTAEPRLTPEVFERQLLDIFHSRSGIDLRDLEAARIPAGAKKLLKELVLVSKQVVVEIQLESNRPGSGLKFIPAIFGARVATRFTEQTHVRLKQTALAPRNPLNAPDPIERTALEEFADPSYPRERVISEVTTKSGSLRLMFPLYTTRKCLACHGDPQGELDRTSYPREGLSLGQNAGAISVMIPIQP
ncbi:MAG: DUF3365 domain-containing protein [Nitrospiraceae bacterium]